ncbi:hypothetical protein Pla52n_00540 [Stieleria varia]|uniref:Uncharacterized protein n=1 Tax=Stieleria varia TaxID=2528005 RepID=A0A5C6B7T6_9BACT|nr:hypothetical protein Pla52n_00540 [Stieleria varia]
MQRKNADGSRGRAIGVLGSVAGVERQQKLSLIAGDNQALFVVGIWNSFCLPWTTVSSMV